MCVHPKYIMNKRYIPNKKNGGNPPPVEDERTLYVPIGCGNCIECLKQKQREWTIRLTEEIKDDNTGKFVTLTLSDESMEELGNIVEKYAEGYVRDNLIATKAVRRFLERWRKKYKKSVKHWLITEWGQNNTERMHLHGIIFTDEIEDIKRIWKYGNVFIGTFVNEKSINYIVKYLGKVDEKHKDYKPKILTSRGIGKGYTKRFNSKLNKYNGEKTKEYYKAKSGHKMALPIYYRNKIYTEKEREQLWLNRLDKGEIWVMGEKIDISTEEGEKEYHEMLKYSQELNRRLGYGGDKIDWNKKKYLEKRRRLKALKEKNNLRDKNK